MKIRLTFKDPDHAVQVEGRDLDNGLVTQAVHRNYCRPWVEFDEYVTIEIDTQDGSARVVPVDE